MINQEWQDELGKIDASGEVKYGLFENFQGDVDGPVILEGYWLMALAAYSGPTLVEQGHPVLASESDLESVVGDLSRAFAHYPLCDWLFRDNPKRSVARDRLFEVLVRMVGFRFGSIYRPVAGGAVAVWIQSESLAKISMLDNLRILAELMPVCYSLRILRLVALHKANSHHSPEYRPYDYLYFLGVDPQHQGQGIGTGLMHDGLQRSDSLDRHVFLETSDKANLKFYERFGFELYDYYDLGKNSPQTWTLLRPPLGSKAFSR